MRLILTIDGRHVATLVENDADFGMGRMNRTGDVSDKLVASGVIKATMTPDTTRKLIKQLEWLLGKHENPETPFEET